MDWVLSVQKNINYIEDNLLNQIDTDGIAKNIYSSNANFQRIFSIITGITIGDYIRCRRLSLAGQELYNNKNKIIDIALKYGYDTPESFTKAFLRFHGVTPSEARITDNSLRYFSPLTIQINVKGGFIMSRKLIPNLAKLYEDPSENYMFDSCMRSVMAALNENENKNENESDNFDFDFFAGITGDLFVQTWRDPKWQYNNEYSFICRNTQGPIRAAFDACGYEYEYVYEEDIKRNKPEYIRKIVDSIDKGYPVLTFGIIGPPICSIICGYDESGDILIGLSQFTDEPQKDNQMDLVCSENYFQVKNGIDRSTALIFFGRKKHTTTISDSFYNSILNIPKLASLAPVDKVCFGMDAFDAWADSLSHDEDFKDEQMLIRPLDTYGSCIVMAGTNMYKIQGFLDRAIGLCPDMKDKIEKLKKAYQEEAEALQKLVEFQGGYFFDADRRALLDKDFRIGLAERIRDVGKCYIKAANSLEQ